MALEIINLVLEIINTLAIVIAVGFIISKWKGLKLTIIKKLQSFKNVQQLIDAIRKL